MEKRFKIHIQTSIDTYVPQMAINEALGQRRKNKKKRIKAISEKDSTSVDSSEDIYLQNEI